MRLFFNRATSSARSNHYREVKVYFFQSLGCNMFLTRSVRCQRKIEKKIFVAYCLVSFEGQSNLERVDETEWRMRTWENLSNNKDAIIEWPIRRDIYQDVAIEEKGGDVMFFSSSAVSPFVQLLS